MEINFYDIMESSNDTYIPSANTYLYMKKVFNYLRILDCISSAGEFSKKYLHKSRDYYARIKCNQTTPSTNAMNNLLGVLEDKCLEYASKPDKQNNYHYLCHLLKEGRFLQMKEAGLC